MTCDKHQCELYCSLRTMFCFKVILTEKQTTINDQIATVASTVEYLLCLTIGDLQRLSGIRVLYMSYPPSCNLTQTLTS